MPITAISRDWGIDPSIVRIVSTDTFSVVTAPGYLTTQLDEIQALQNGNFTWTDTDVVLMTYNGGRGFFNRNTATATFTALSNLQYAKIPMTAAEFNGMYAAPKLIIPAAGANTIILPRNVMYEVDFGGAQFAAGGPVQLQYTATVNGAGAPASAATAANVFTAFAADGVVGALGSLASATAAATINQGIYLSNTTAAFTTGTSTVDVHVWYSVASTTF